MFLKKTSIVYHDSICSTIFSLPAAFYFVFYYYTSWERVSVLKKIYCSHRKVQSPKKAASFAFAIFFKSRNALNLLAQWKIFCCLQKYRKRSKSSLRLHGGGGWVFIFYSIFFVLLRCPLKYCNSLITNYLKKSQKNVSYTNFNFEVDFLFYHLWQFDIDLTGIVCFFILGH